MLKEKEILESVMVRSYSLVFVPTKKNNWKAEKILVKQSES